MPPQHGTAHVNFDVWITCPDADPANPVRWLRVGVGPVTCLWGPLRGWRPATVSSLLWCCVQELLGLQDPCVSAQR